jgi:4-amino-4-deoxy-L-arabinose transferase-like glycosyltransferase
MNDGPDTAERLRQALGAVADGVLARPDAYQRALAEWRRRERRRRLVGVVLACLLVAVADVVGVWALNHSPATAPVVFNAPPPAVAPPAVSPPAVSPPAVSPPAVPGGKGSGMTVQRDRVSGMTSRRGSPSAF